MRPAADSQRFDNVQALRGVASLMVVVFHLQAWDTAFGNPTPVVREVRWFGFAGVDLFFVLSGFIIAATNRRHFGRPAAVPGFLFRRAWRVYPAYWAAVALTVAAGWWLVDREGHAAAMAGWWPAWLGLVPVEAGNLFVPQAWTLSYELMFYAAFGALLCLPARAAAAALVGWAAVVAVAALRPAPRDPLAALPLSPFVLEFLGGCLVAWLTGRGERRGWRAAGAAGLVVGAAGAVVIQAQTRAGGVDPTESWARVPLFGAAGVLLVYAAVAAEGRWPRRVPGWLLRAGDASYSLYLTHHAVIMASVILVGYAIPHSRAPHTLWLAGTFAACVAVGFAFHAGVERPLLGLARRRKPAAPAVAPASPPPVARAA